MQPDGNPHPFKGRELQSRHAAHLFTRMRQHNRDSRAPRGQAPRRGQPTSAVATTSSQNRDALPMQLAAEDVSGQRCQAPAGILHHLQEADAGLLHHQPVDFPHLLNRN